MKTILIILFLFTGIIGCSNKDSQSEFTYIKILTIGKSELVTRYNKGLQLLTYLYYNPITDSVTFRYMQSVDPATFRTYVGNFSKRKYVDSIIHLVSMLKRFPNGTLQETLSSSSAMYSGPELYVEYKDKKGVHFNSFLLDGNDTLEKVWSLILNLEQSPWDKGIVSNNTVDDESEMINSLKGQGKYDSITTPYIPLPCDKGIEMNKLYGKWRTIGDKYNDHTLNYRINTIDEKGNWILERMYNSQLELVYSGKIKIINKDHSIKIRSDLGETIIEVLNLTANCLEYRVKGSKGIWRLDRMN